MHDTTIDDYIAANDVEFIDFGASKGGSTDLAAKIFGRDSKKGIGIDISHDKVAAMTAAGYRAFAADVLQLRLTHSVRFVIMSHFLEHLGGYQMAQKALVSAAELSREFFFVQQPYFDMDGYLLERGLKFYWSDWHGHTYAMHSLEFYRILRDLLLRGEIDRFALYLSGPVPSFHDTVLIPLEAPKDQHHYDPNLHPEKPGATLSEIPGLYKELRVLATKNPEAGFEALEKRFSWEKKIFDSFDRDMWCAAHERLRDPGAS